MFAMFKKCLQKCLQCLIKKMLFAKNCYEERSIIYMAHYCNLAWSDFYLLENTAFLI